MKKSLSWKHLGGRVRVAAAAFALLAGALAAESVVPAAPGGGAEAAPTRTPTKRRTVRKTRKNEMTMQKKTPVAAGAWAGEGIRLDIADGGGSTLQFDCASGEIPEALAVDENGEFKAQGYYTRRRPGPQREGDAGLRSPATFSGRVERGKTMTLRIVLTETNDPVGDFTLELGKSARIVRCL